MNSIFDNFLLVVVVGVLLALVVSLVGGALIAALASFGSRFFRRNLPTDEEMAQLKAEFNKPGRAWKRPKIGPVAEPLVISIVGFVLFFFVSSAALGAMAVPVPGVDSAAEAPLTDATPAASLPKEGDLASITASLPEGNVESGQQLFSTEGCVGCHSQEKDVRMVGPTFYNLWDTAATRVPGLGSEEYLYQSIVDPNAYVVDTYQPGLMQQNYASLLSPQEMADILAWIEAKHSNEP